LHSKADASMSQGTSSVRKRKKKKMKKKMKKKSKLYYFSKKELAKLRMRTASNEYKFRGPSNLLDFGNVDVADIAGVTNGVL
jgi:hypothetical protein